MKPLLYVLAAILILATSCSKKTEQDYNYWTVNGRELEAVSVIRTPYIYLEATTGSSHVRFYFNQFPTSTSSYRLVAAAQPPTTPPAIDEIYVTVSFMNQTWSSTGLDTSAIINVVIDDTKGRLTIYTADMWLRNATHTDSIKVSTHIKEF